MASERETTTSTPTGTHTHTTTSSGGGGVGLAFILGGVVVALGVLAWLFLGGDADVATGGEGGTTVNIEAPAADTNAPAADDASGGAESETDAGTTSGN